MICLLSNFVFKGLFDEAIIFLCLIVEVAKDWVIDTVTDTDLLKLILSLLKWVFKDAGLLLEPS